MYWYLLLGGAARFMVEFVRVNPRVFYMLSEAQLIALAMMIIGAIALITHLGKRSGGDRSAARREGSAPGDEGGAGLIAMEIKDRILYLVAGIVVMTGLALVVLSGHRGTRIENSGEISGGSEAPVAAGSQAADFKLEKLDGTTVSLESLRGKVVFLNVWATWCEPCREEMPSMQTLYDDFKANKDFVMLAVSQDAKGREVVAPYVAKNGYQFTVLLDPENKIMDTYDRQRGARDVYNRSQGADSRAPHGRVRLVAARCQGRVAATARRKGIKRLFDASRPTFATVCIRAALLLK